MLDLFSIFIFGFTIGLLITVILKRRKVKYDGAIIITENEDGKKLFSIELHEEPEDLEQKETVVFKIMKAVPSVKVE